MISNRTMARRGHFSASGVVGLAALALTVASFVAAGFRWQWGWLLVGSALACFTLLCVRVHLAEGRDEQSAQHRDH